MGEFGANKLVAILSMTPREHAKLALRRAMRSLHLEPVEVRGIPFEIKIAGVVADIDFENLPDAAAFSNQLSTQLGDMAARIRTIHAYS